MKNGALNESELIELLLAVARTSKSIRTNINLVGATTAKMVSYEQLLRVVELFQDQPDYVRSLLRTRKLQQPEK